MQSIKKSELLPFLQNSELVERIDSKTVPIPKKYIFTNFKVVTKYEVVINNSDDFVKVMDQLRFYGTKDLPWEVYDWVLNNKTDVSQFKDFHYDTLHYLSQMYDHYNYDKVNDEIINNTNSDINNDSSSLNDTEPSVLDIMLKAVKSENLNFVKYLFNKNCLDNWSNIYFPELCPDHYYSNFDTRGCDCFYGYNSYICHCQTYEEEKHSYHEKCKSIWKAVFETHNIDMIDYLLKSNFMTSIYNDEWSYLIIETGSIELVKKYIKTNQYANDPWLCVPAASFGYFDILKFLREELRCKVDNNIFSKIITSINVKIELGDDVVKIHKLYPNILKSIMYILDGKSLDFNRIELRECYHLGLDIMKQIDMKKGNLPKTDEEYENLASEYKGKRVLFV